MHRPTLARLSASWPAGAPRASGQARTRGAVARGRTLAAVALLALVGSAAAPSVITLRPGDTLWDLARAHGTTVAELQRLNGLSGNGMIYAGRQLKLPGSTGGSGGSGSSQGAAGSGRTHLVRSGDTLSGLAASYGVPVRAIAEANGLPGSGLIRIGTSLSIPGGGTPTLSPETQNAGVRIPDAVRASVAGHRATLSQRSLPSRDAVRAMVTATARQHGVDPALALAVSYHESGFQQGVVSPVDAIGVMQVLPSTGRGLNAAAGRSLDLLNTQDNVTAGVLLLRQLVSATGSDDAALAGYYQGLTSVAAQGRLPQTDAYIKNVSALRPRFSGN